MISLPLDNISTFVGYHPVTFSTKLLNSAQPMVCTAEADIQIYGFIILRRSRGLMRTPLL
jgi:hypothetical protein